MRSDMGQCLIDGNPKVCYGPLAHLKCHGDFGFPLLQSVYPFRRLRLIGQGTPAPEIRHKPDTHPERKHIYFILFSIIPTTPILILVDRGAWWFTDEFLFWTLLLRILASRDLN